MPSNGILFEPIPHASHRLWSVQFNTFLRIADVLNLTGVRVFESPLLEAKPKLKLSPACPVSDEFRAEMDAWLLDRFCVDPETFGKSVVVPGGIAMAPSLVRALWERNG